MTGEEKKDIYLNDFKRKNRPREIGWPNAEGYGIEIVELLRTKEGLTYEEAYASLQYAYNLLEYHSNFLKVQR